MPENKNIPKNISFYTHNNHIEIIIICPESFFCKQLITVDKQDISIFPFFFPFAGKPISFIKKTIPISTIQGLHIKHITTSYNDYNHHFRLEIVTKNKRTLLVKLKNDEKITFTKQQIDIFLYKNKLI